MGWATTSVNIEALTEIGIQKLSSQISVRFRSVLVRLIVSDSMNLSKVRIANLPVEVFQSNSRQEYYGLHQCSIYVSLSRPMINKFQFLFNFSVSHSMK